MTAERYRFSADALAVAARRLRRRFAATLVATAAIVALVWSIALRPRGSGWGTLAFSLALLLALAALSLRRRFGRLHERWSSFAVVLDEVSIAREVRGFAPVRIARADVTAIEERGVGIVVRGRSGEAVLVPRELEGYGRVREALATWAPPRA